MKVVTILIIGLVLVCISGIAAAAENDSVQMYGEENKQNVLAQFDRVNLGDVFAMVDLLTKLGLLVVGIALAAMFMYGRVASKPECYKNAMIGMFAIIGICMLLQIYLSWTSDLAPSMQYIEF